MTGFVVEVGVGASQVEALLAQAERSLARGPTDGELQEAVDLLMYRILERTSRGLSANRRAFAPYAERTRAGKARRGRRAGVVTLADSGEMLAAMTGSVQRGLGVIYFNARTAGQRALWLHEGTRHMPARPFLDASRSERDEAAKMIAARIAARLG